MKIFILLVALAASNAQALEFSKTNLEQAIPEPALNMIHSFVNHHCQFTLDYTLESMEITHAKVETYPGYTESTKNVEVKMDLTYGNEDMVRIMEQHLILENTTGHYGIVKATGPCDTIINE